MDDRDGWFTRMYTRCHPRVLAYAWRRVVPDRAHEIADETFLIAWRRRDELPDDVLPWLLVTARNVISEHLRKGLRQDALAVELARCSEVSVPGADVIAVERITVLRALMMLAEPDRDALMLTVWDGLSTRRAAAAAGCSVPTFAVRLHRARRRLANALEQLDGRAADAQAADVRPTDVRAAATAKPASECT